MNREVSRKPEFLKNVGGSGIVQNYVMVNLTAW